MSEKDQSCEAKKAACAIIKRQFGIDDPNLESVSGGLSNHVFETKVDESKIVIRLGPAGEQTETFARERCVIEHVRKEDIPAPEVLAHGEEGNWAYMIARRIAGKPAMDHPDRIDILRCMGRLAARQVHLISPGGFGTDFALAGACGSGKQSWRGWLDTELCAAGRLDTLYQHKILSEDQHAAFTEILDEMRGWKGPPALNHGDLRLKNVVVDDDGAIVWLIDWELCVSAVGPHWDISVSLHDLTIDEKEAFLEGLGLCSDDIHAAAPAWRLFNAINYVPELEKRVADGDREWLRKTRHRFAGSLDLYA